MKFKKEEIREKYKDLFEFSLDLIYVNDLRGNFLDANDVALKKLGFKRDEIPDISFIDLLDRDNLMKAIKVTNEIRKTGKQSERSEYKLKTKEGKFIYVETYAIPLKRNEKIYAILGIGNDVTKRKLAEQKLRESEEKYRYLFEDSPFAIILINSKGEIIDSSPATEVLVGYNRSDLQGKKFKDLTFIHPDFLPMLIDLFDRFIKGEVIHRIDIQLYRKDGSLIWASLQASLVKLGSETYIQAIIQDVSEQKESQIKLEESESKFRTIFEAIPDLYFLVSGDATILDYKGKEQELYLSPEEFMGKKVVDLMPPYIGKSIVELVKKTLRTQQPQSLEYDLQMKDKKHFYESRYFYMSKDKVSIFIRDITERKNIEKQISDLARFPSENPNPVLRVNRERIIYINKAGRDLFDLSEGSKIPNSLREIIIKVFNENTTKILEVEFGEKIYMFNITPILQEGYANIYGGDITERKKSEIALNIEKRFSDDILNSSVDTIFVFNPESGRAVRWNNVFKQVCGYSNGEIASIKAPNSYYGEEDLKRASEATKNVLKEGTFKLEMSLITKDGRRIPYEYTGTTLKNSFGDKLIVSVGRDISERKIAEEKIKDSEEKFRDLYEKAPIAYFSIDPEQSILRINKAAERLLGYEKDEFLKMKVFDLYSDTDYGLKKAKKVFAKFIGGESIKDVELQMANKEGNPIWVSISVKPIFDSKGNVIESRSMVLDITDRKIAEEALKHSEKRYKEAYDRGNFYKDLFAHDINNILQVINSSAELIAYQLGESEKSKEIENISDIIKRQVSRGSKLVSNVRTLAELEEKEIITRKVEIGSLLRNSIIFVEKAYEERNVSIAVSSIDGNYFTYANELLQDVFENVLINAIKYNENSNIEISIRISKQEIDEKNYFKIEFIDNGIGVAEHRKEVIFKSGNRELKGSKGMGLGLSLVNKILQIFNGKIWVEDNVKGDYTQGSNFIILLPEVQ